MATVRDYAAAGVPSWQLGKSFRDWDLGHVNMILRHFGVNQNVRRGKKGQQRLEILRILDRVTKENNLTKEDATSIVRGGGLKRTGPPTDVTPPSTTNTRPLPPQVPRPLKKSPHINRRSNTHSVQGGRYRPGEAAVARSRLRRLNEIRNAARQANAPISHANNAVIGIVHPDTTTLGFTMSRNPANASGALRQTPNQKECTVCMESLALESYPKAKITLLCEHVPDVCLKCLAQSIATQFTTKVWDQVDCPTCSERLQYADIKRYADAAIFTKYDNLSLEACLKEAQGAQFQRCRMPDCKSGQYCFSDEDSYMVCRECGGRTCITCDVQWHPDISCTNVATKRAEERNGEEAAAGEYLTNNSKLCPQCHIRGEKVNGCDHMSCPQCHHQYCWICLADYQDIRRQGNHMHDTNCTHHSNNLPGLPDVDPLAPTNYFTQRPRDIIPAPPALDLPGPTAP